MSILTKCWAVKKTMREVYVIKEFLISCGDQKINSGINAMIDVSAEVGTQGGFVEEES